MIKMTHVNEFESLQFSYVFDLHKCQDFMSQTDLFGFQNILDTMFKKIHAMVTREFCGMVIYNIGYIKTS